MSLKPALRVRSIGVIGWKSRAMLMRVLGAEIPTSQKNGLPLAHRISDGRACSKLAAWWWYCANAPLLVGSSPLLLRNLGPLGMGATVPMGWL